MRRQARLFAIAEHLRGRRTGVTAEELAAQFSVSQRTLFRDLAALRDASLPIVGDRGRGGGMALDRAYTLPPVNFSPREAAVLVAIGSFAAEMRLFPFSDTLRAALDKVRGALGLSAQRELIEHLRSLQFVGVPAPPVRTDIRRAVEEAWFEQQPVALRYTRGDASAGERMVHIRGLVMERGQTLVQCEDVETREKRSLRLDRIDEVRAQKKPLQPWDRQSVKPGGKKKRAPPKLRPV